MQLTIDWAWLVIATRHSNKGQTSGASLARCEDAACQLLLTTSTLLRAFLRFPLRDFAILEESRVSTTFEFIELASNLFQRTQLRLEGDVVVAAFLHLRDQVCVILIILLVCLTGDLTSSTLFLGGRSQLDVGCGQEVLVVFDRSLKGLLLLFTVPLNPIDIFEELIALVCDTPLDSQEARLQLVALRRLLNCALRGTLVLWGRSTCVRIGARITWHHCLGDRRIYKLCLVHKRLLIS